MVMDFEFEINDEEIMALLKRGFMDVVSRAVELTALEVWGNIGREAPTDHGRLAGSYDVHHVGRFAYGIHSNVEYRWYVHEGTGLYGPHKQRIYPRRAKALKFYWDKIGETVIFKGDLETPQERARFAQWAEDRGMKPFFTWPAGRKPDRYIDRSIEQASGRIDEFARRAAREAL